MTHATDRIEKQTLLHAPRERVWQAIRQPEQFGHWFGAEFDGDFAPGRHLSGRIVPTQVDPEVAKMQEPYRGAALELDVHRIEPERLLAFRWHPGVPDPAVDPAQQPTTLVEFALDDAPGGTLLTITESGFDRLPSDRRQEAYASNEGGWEKQLELIDKYLAQNASGHVPES
ncbi:SRPBCC family protein [Montanilutibacter psychrotolerans]|uniref:Vanillate O-demethylase oxidoreductase VanB n=1 Tax=Montanilutibacter psychrotolerans TaxID=1327343 RepID=A0A3M8SWK0_9GAMM|nr:SRPBCC family protein [Lysobacter psychrotolerans]RNF83082.1 vanillate O-demethylase oxidoreductase VanB [Lysobacter psychrotolerans]